MDNKTTGAFSLNIYKDSYTNKVGEVFKRHGQPIQFRGVSAPDPINFFGRGNRLPDEVFIVRCNISSTTSRFYEWCNT